MTELEDPGLQTSHWEPTREHVVICVDDKTPVLGSLKRLLRREPYDFRTTPAPREALKWIEDEMVSLLITDQRMLAGHTAGDPHRLSGRGRHQAARDAVDPPPHHEAVERRRSQEDHPPPPPRVRAQGARDGPGPRAAPRRGPSPGTGTGHAPAPDETVGRLGTPAVDPRPADRKEQGRPIDLASPASLGTMLEPPPVPERTPWEIIVSLDCAGLTAEQAIERVAPRLKNARDAGARLLLYVNNVKLLNGSVAEFMDTLFGRVLTCGAHVTVVDPTGCVGAWCDAAATTPGPICVLREPPPDTPPTRA